MIRIALRYGIPMFLGFVGFFLIMQVFGLAEQYNFRVFNAIIHLTFITLAIKAYVKVKPEEFNYLSGTAAGVVTSFVGVLLFAIFQLIYLSNNPEFMSYLQENMETFGRYLTPKTAALAVFLEGVGVSIIGSYIVMRFVDAAIRKKDAYDNDTIRES